MRFKYVCRSADGGCCTEHSNADIANVFRGALTAPAAVQTCDALTTASIVRVILKIFRARVAPVETSLFPTGFSMGVFVELALKEPAQPVIDIDMFAACEPGHVLDVIAQKQHPPPSPAPQ